MTTSSERKDKVLYALPALQAVEARAYQTLEKLFESDFNGVNLIFDAKAHGYSLEQVMEVADLFIRAALYDRPVTGCEMLDDKRFDDLDVQKTSNLAEDFKEGGMLEAVKVFVSMARTKLSAPDFASDIENHTHAPKWDRHINTWIREQLRASIRAYYQSTDVKELTSVEQKASSTPDETKAEQLTPTVPTDRLLVLDRIAILRQYAAIVQKEISAITNKIFIVCKPNYTHLEDVDLFIAQEALLAIEDALVQKDILILHSTKTRTDRSLRATSRSERPRLKSISTSDENSVSEIKALRLNIKELVNANIDALVGKINTLKLEAYGEVQVLGGNAGAISLKDVTDRLVRSAINTRDESILEMIEDANKGLKPKMPTEAVIIPE